VARIDLVGTRLRYFRTKLGFSQRRLAKKAGIASSTVSLIESGAISPSIGSLKRILDAAGISLAEFFNSDPPKRDQVFFRKDELSPISRGAISYRQVGNDLSRDSLQILYESYQPGADTGRVLLSHEGQEGGVIIEGQLEVTVGDHVRVLGPGDAYLFYSKVQHRFRNVSKKLCTLISACTPPSF
jgi:transcriptional regulator with XRE-family HTH domain